MRQQSAADTARRARRSVLFKAGLCIQDCGRPASETENLCEPCSRALVVAYFTRIGEPIPPRRETT